ncbi:DUF6385 domain-containing protein [Clostridium lamae]|uniref:DUF6385 domain-containing protein n=1 Tax=Clostridium TaxID=1485 RepID=UPI00374F0B9A
MYERRFYSIITVYPEATYISNSQEYANYYYKKTLLVGSSNSNNVNYVSIFKFSSFDYLKDINTINAYLNIKSLNKSKVTIYDLSKNIKLCKLIENFNIEKVSWSNPPKAITVDLTESDYNYDDNLNILSLNISSIIKNDDDTIPIYGLALLCRPTFRDTIYNFYSSNSCEPPFITINYDKNEFGTLRNLYSVFKEKEFTVESNNSEFYSQTINIHNYNNATYFIKNLSNSNLSAILQISPDGCDFTNDVVVANILAGESAALNLTKFLKFSRIKFINLDGNTNSSLQIWLQGQTFDYHLR